ncbi:S-layer homology domain-containing protein [Butyricicoccus sp. AF18-9LB]|uniref:S-layer homology domain-containing protein n=1 Tax=Butyricicoccus sp. AF18-9LB TaxID=3002521 RepID=UPI0018F59387|nr:MULTISPECIES: S-layer homology domain-containing protein [unclassified Butyricicoccus]
MKKRILSILLCLCMAACMLPTVAFAADKGKAIQLGTNALNKNVNTATAPTVYFGQDHGDNPGAWRVIGYDGNGVAGAQGDMTLLAASNMGVVKFANDAANNKYAPSNLKTAIDKLAGKLTAEENAAVKKRTLTSGKYNEENTDCVAGAQVDNAVFWPLSSKEAIAVNNDLRIADKENPKWASSYWWLRSPGSSAYVVAVVKGNGSVSCTGHSLVTEIGVRPAFNLNLNSVLFTSAAVDGKPDGGLTEVSKYSGNEWKLTLLDNSRNFAVTETTASGDPGDTLTLHYNGATTGANEYISVILADNSGAQYYGRVAQPTEATGTVEIKIPSDIAPGSYTLKIFSEQYNGDYKTDYASNFTDIALTVEKQADEQFTLTPGGRYYFDLSAMGIPGTVNDALPDNTLHYVPLTYAGTVDAYKLMSEMATTEEYAQQNKYPHSLFIADYNVTHKINWDDLNTANLIFGKDYAASGVDYTLRAPSVGSRYTGSGESQRGTPQSNEWDRVLDKDDGYIKNRNKVYSWGQDTPNFGSGFRAVRGYYSARHWYYYSSSYQNVDLGFRPVLEVPNPGSLGPGGLKAVTLDLGGGKLGGSTDTIQIIVKNGSKFTAPASDGMTRPDGNTGSYFKWLGSDGNLYAPGEIVPEVVTTLTAQWTVHQYTITYDLAGGTVEGNPNTYTIETKAFTLKKPTKSGYTFTGWSGTGLDGENNMTVTIPTGSTGNRIYTAHWRYNGSGHSYSYYTIKATAGAGGSISPSGNVSVREGRDRTFTITPDKGYAISNVKIDGKSIGAVKSYTFENVSRTHTIEVIFMKANGNPQTGVFVDVATGSYYEDAVDWAVENGITKGTDDTHFSPDGICTRAQAVTFLWRTAGSPASKTSTMPFTDVPVGSYYYDAVLWAVENGITKGTSDTTFSPNMTCTRAQIVAFLWRSEKSPAAGTANPFADVKSTAYYADAVLWAVKENITKGTTSTTFSPNADCTRAQIVTFLWRCKK